MSERMAHIPRGSIGDILASRMTEHWYPVEAPRVLPCSVHSCDAKAIWMRRTRTVTQQGQLVLAHYPACHEHTPESVRGK